MSYIRSTCNPESLYIWGDGKICYFSVGSKKHVTMPTDIFNGLLKKFRTTGYYEDTKFKGAEIKEVKRGKNFKMELSYGDWKIYMWAVTWYYIVSSNKK